MKLSYWRRRTPQLLLVACLLLVQIGLLAHQAQHQQLGGSETHCALCTVADHLGHAPVSTGALPTILSVYLLLSVALSTPLRFQRAYVQNPARAPPYLSPQ